MTFHRSCARLACAVTASLLSLPAAAADEVSGLYLDAGVGVNWAQDVDIDVAGLSGTGDLDVGSRVGVAVGYNFNEYLGVELDSAWLYNEFDKTDSSISHLPLMLNGVVRFPTDSGLEPYLGAGFGGSINLLYIDDLGIEEGDADFNFGWQAMAGLRYRFRNHMSVGVGYQYFGTSSSDYEIEGVHVDVGTSHNHTLDFTFNVEF